MQKFMLFLLFALPVTMFAQSESIEFSAGAGYSYRSLSYRSDDAVTHFIKDGRKGEVGKLSYHFGFHYNQPLASKWYLKVGLQFASIGYKGEKKTGLRWGTEHDGNGGWGGPDPNLPHEIQLIRSHAFIEMPVAVRREFSAKKLAPFIEAGISPAIYLTTRLEQDTDLHDTADWDKNEQFNTAHLAANLAFGIQYAPAEKWQFYAAPAFKYYITKLVDAPIGEHLWAGGLEVGVRKMIL